MNVTSTGFNARRGKELDEYPGKTKMVLGLRASGVSLDFLICISPRYIPPTGRAGSDRHGVFSPLHPHAIDAPRPLDHALGGRSFNRANF